MTEQYKRLMGIDSKTIVKGRGHHKSAEPRNCTNVKTVQTVLTKKNAVNVKGTGLLELLKKFI